MSLLDNVKKPIDENYKNQIIIEAKEIATYFGDEFSYKDGTGKYYLYKYYDFSIKYNTKDDNSVVQIFLEDKEKFNSTEDAYCSGGWEETLHKQYSKFKKEYPQNSMGMKISYCGRYICSKMNGETLNLEINPNVRVEAFLFDVDGYMGNDRTELRFRVYQNTEIVFDSVMFFMYKQVDFSKIADYARITKHVKGDWQDELINYVAGLINTDSALTETEDVTMEKNGIQRIRRSYF